MHFFDIFILVASAYGVFKGLTKGLVHILLSFVGFIAGLYLAANFSGMLIPYLAEQFHSSPGQMQWAAYFVIFFGAILIAWLASKLITKILKEAGLGWLNRLGGALLSTAKYLFIAGLIFVLIEETNRRFAFLPENYTENSKFFKPVTQETRQIIHLLSGSKIFRINQPANQRDSLR